MMGAEGERERLGALDKTIDPKHYFRLIWRRKGLVVLCAVTSLCATFIALSFVPKEYESKVTLMIENSQMLSHDLQNVTGGLIQNPVGYGVDEERASKLIGRILSRPFLERVIRMLKMNEDPAIRAQAEEERKKHPEVSVDEMAVRILSKNLQSRLRFVETGPGVYQVIVSDYSAENAQTIAKWISELFLDISNQSAIERLKTAHDFGTEQLKIYEAQLQQSEEALRSYKESQIQVSLVSNIVRSDNIVLAEALNQRIEDDVAAARIRLMSYSTALLGMGITTDQNAVLQDPKVAGLAGNLSSALRSALADRMTGPAGSEVGEWPPPGSYRTVRSDLLQQIETVAAEHYPAAGADVLGTVARFVFSKIDLDSQVSAAGTLASAISAFKRQAEALPGGEIELNRLEQEVDTNRKLLQSFQSQLVASDISQAVEITKLGLQIEIIDPASLPLTPSRPDQKKILLASLLLGPLLGIGVAFLGETMDMTLRNLHDFRRVVPEPVLGTTPLLSRLTFHQSRARRYWIPATLVGLIVLTGAFYAVRTSLVRKLVTSGQPVQMVNPEKVPNENH